MADTITAKDIPELIKSVVGVEVKKLLAEMAEVNDEHSKAIDELVEESKAKRSEKVAVEPMTKAQRDERLGLFFRCIGASQNNGRHAVELAEKAGDKVLAKALGQSTGSAGGFLVPEILSDDFVEALYGDSVIMNAGARPVDMPEGNLTFATMASGSGATYGAENTNTTNVDQTFGELKMSAKKLTSITVVSNELLEQGSPANDAIIREDMIDEAVERMDLGLLRDDGTGSKMAGLFTQCDASHKIAASGVAVDDFIKDVATLIQKVAEAKIRMRQPALFLSPRTERFALTAKDGLGGFLFKDEMKDGTLLGIPWYRSTNIPINLGVGTDESEIYFAEMSQILVGQTRGMSVKAFDGGAYFDGANVQSGIAQDQTVMRLTARHDVLDRRGGFAIAIVTGARYGV